MEEKGTKSPSNILAFVFILWLFQVVSLSLYFATVHHKSQYSCTRCVRRFLHSGILYCFVYGFLLFGVLLKWTIYHIIFQCIWKSGLFSSHQPSSSKRHVCVYVRDVIYAIQYQTINSIWNMWTICCRITSNYIQTELIANVIRLVLFAFHWLKSK